MLRPSRRVPTLGDITPSSGTTPIDISVLAESLKIEALPLMLMPMRLEYRFIPAAGAITLNRTAINKKIEALGSILPSGSKSKSALTAERKTREKLKKLRADLNLRNPGSVSLVPAEKLLIRWYPDEAFSEKGVAPPTVDELESLKRLNTRLNGELWWDTSVEIVATAWQEFTGNVGIERGIHLKRKEGEKADPNWEARIGRISALPEKVGIFTLQNGKVLLLAESEDIPQNMAKVRSAISLTPEALTPGNWLHDFNIARKYGMGVSITGASKLAQAKAADWVIAIGLSDANGVKEVEQLLENRIANGEFELLCQDTATNNTSAEPTEFKTNQTQAIDYTARATALEQDAFNTKKATAADLFSEALGINSNVVRQAINSADHSFEDAKAMLTVIGPALLDEALDGTTLLPGVGENDFIEVMAASMVARGVLPSFRMGPNPFGLLPVTNVKDLTFPTGDMMKNETRSVQGLLAFLAKLARSELPGVADDRVPVLKPDDPSASEKFERILMTNRAGVRIDVTEAKLDESKPIGCPYVEGKSVATQYRAKNYLRQLRSSSLRSLVDPDSRNFDWPLLYRLARVSVNRNSINVIHKSLLNIKDRKPITERLTLAEKRQVSRVQTQVENLTLEGLSRLTNTTLVGVAKTDIALITKASSNFAQALGHLETIAERPSGIAQLEMLLVEVIDLFQHRVDAYATGLAYAKLKRNRENGQKGLKLGYFAMLSKLRTKSITSKTDGYVQAPSQSQATTAAVLRSSYLRHKAEGAFEINLSANRVRSALELLDLASKGHSLSESLGLRGEHWLHENKQDKLIYQIRKVFPIKTADKDLTSRRMFDGLVLVDAKLNKPGESIYKPVQAILVEYLDAFSDLVMAEATHQRVLGQSGAANAWLQVLSGGVPPGFPTVVKTHRHGHGTDYRISVLLPEGDHRNFTSVRGIAEPSVSSLASVALKDVDKVSVAVHALKTDGTPGPELLVNLKNDLSFSAMDMLIGGWSELQSVVRATMLNRLMNEPDLLDQLQAGNSISDFESGVAQLTVTARSTGPDLFKLLETATQMNRMILRSRALESFDLNAAADAMDGPLSEQDRINVEAYSAKELHERVVVLSARLKTDLQGAVGQDGLIQHLADYRSAVDALLNAVEAGTVSVVNLQVQAEAARAKLSVHLMKFVYYGCRPAAQVPILSDALADTNAEFVRLGNLVAQLEVKRAALDAATGTPTDGFSSYSQARGARDSLIAVLRLTLDGDSLPVLPPLPRSSKRLRPLLDTKTTSEAALGHWVDTRPSVEEAVDFGRNIKSVKTANVSSEAWDDERDLADIDKDNRAENIAPRAVHRGTFIGEASILSSNAAVAGFVADEWVDQRPAETQEAAIAVNYDTPQSEPPNITLLCIPPSAKISSWTMDSAAQMVAETISWMKIRALVSEDRLTPRAMLPFINEVSYKIPSNLKSKRIPVSKPRYIFSPWSDSSGKFKSVAANSTAQTNRPHNERDGFRSNKE